MLALTLQTLLLLGVAYLLGCAVGCMLKRALMPNRRAVGVSATAMPASAGAPGTTARSPLAPPAPLTIARGPLPVLPIPPKPDAFRRADTLEPAEAAPRAGPATAVPAATPVAKPAASPPASSPTPAIQSPARQVPQQTPPAAGATTRFEDALSGAGTAPAVPRPTQPIPASARQQSSPPTPSPGPASAAQPEATLPRRSTGAGETLVAVAATAAAVAAAQVRSGMGRHSTPTARPQQQPVPGPSGVVQGPATVGSAPSGEADDLKRIRAVDTAIAGKLAQLGVRSYAQIAAWKPEDVARINAALGSKGRVEQENWIEQAQILARGEETFYSRRLPKSAAAQSPPTETVSPRPTVAAPQPPPTPTGKPPSAPPGRDTTLSTTAAAVAAAAASRAASIPVARPAIPPTAVSPQKGPSPAGSVPPVTSTGAATVRAATPSSAPTAPSSGGSVPLVSAAGAQGIPATTPSSDPATPPSTGRAAPTSVPGVSVARSSPPSAPAVPSLEPASPKAPAGPSTVAGARAAVPAEEAKPPRVNPVAVTAPTSSARTTGERQNDLSSLRSVRSEAFRPGDAQSTASGVRPARSTVPDDLKRIRGIGVLIERKLNGMGVTSYEQIANWSANDIDRVSEVLDFKGRIERENWVEQARILATGGQTEFTRRNDPS